MKLIAIMGLLLIGASGCSREMIEDLQGGANAEGDSSVSSAPATPLLGDRLFPRNNTPPTFNVTNYGAVLSDQNPDDAAFTACIDAAIQAKGICQIPAGQLTLSIYPNILRRQSDNAPNINANGAIIEGVGHNSLVKGISVHGFDVFQLNAVSNLTIRDLAISAVKTTDSTTHGVNGISMTNGANNIIIDNVKVFDLPYVDKGNYLDGGKAFTIQQGKLGKESSTNIEVRNSIAINCPYGFGIDAAADIAPYPGIIKVTGNTFSQVFAGAAISFSAKSSGGTDVPGFALNLSKNTINDARYPILLSRAPNVTVQENSTNTFTLPNFPDRTTFAGHAVILIGTKNLAFKGNTIKHKAGTLQAMVLTGGTFTQAWTEGAAFSLNTLEGTAALGFKLAANDGVSTRNSSFSWNKFIGVSTSYDAALTAASLGNAVR